MLNQNFPTVQLPVLIENSFLSGVCYQNYKYGFYTPFLN